jgi:hypothetical protein
MTKLSTDELLYLLYAYSYSLEGKTVTKSNLKKDLSNYKLKESPERISDFLLKQELLASPKNGRISVTQKGFTSLVDNLLITDYQFESSSPKGKILNTLLHCIKELANSNTHVIQTSNEIDFEFFLEQFKKFYFQEKERQEVSGVVAIRKQDIYQNFKANDSLFISELKFDQYFDLLKSTGKIFTSVGEEDELVHWAE